MFRADLYRGTAADYDKFRLPYPLALIDSLYRRTQPSGRGRLLDLACGPGTVTFALCDRFAEVWAVDQESEAVDLAARKARDSGVHNVRWMAARAEDVDPTEAFDLVTIGTAFHRLDRPRVAALARGWLRNGGHLALLWSSTPVEGVAPWQLALSEIFVEWMGRAGVDDRIPPQLQEHLARHPHVEVLEDAGFVDIERDEFAMAHDWSVESLIGFLYSTSVLSRIALGAQAPAFERDVEERLLAIEPSGIFRDEASFAVDLARA